MTDFLFIGKEIDIQSHLVDNMDYILNSLNLPEVKEKYEFLKLKSPLANIITDITVLHLDNTASIFEIKKYKNETQICSSIGQLLLQAEIFKANYNEYPRLFLVSNYIPLSCRVITKSINIKINLLELDGDKVTCY